MKVYDCFTFYNEFELLELRLKSLWDVVDYFVLVEADKNHTNKPKPFYFDERKEDFKEFLPKIRHIPLKVDIDYKGVGDWQIENGQRNGIMYGLSDAEPDDLIFISDLDEFPAPDILQRIENNQEQLVGLYPLTPPLADGRILRVPCQLLVQAKNLLDHYPIVMDQQRHDYYFDWLCQGTWPGTVLTRRKNLITPQQFRDWRYALPRIHNGGWHFSWMGGLKMVINKMTNIVDGNEFVVKSSENLTDANYVKECLRTGKDVYKLRPDYIPYDESKINLPYLAEFLKKYPQFLRKYDFGDE